ncbi:MAG: hypothetical protein WKG01_26225 [Kofleriaceae bacterium]
MMRTTIGLLVMGALLGAGCKGDKVMVPDPQTKSDLEICQKNSLEKDKLIKDLEAANTKLQMQGSGGEVVVVIEGDLMTVKAGKPGDPRPPIDPTAATAAAKEFENLVKKSRGAIQKCYEQALKKNSGLQSKTITLTVFASFAQTGAYKNASFSPSLGDAFDQCIQGVATRWVLNGNAPAQQFKASVSLTPS